MKTTIGVLGEFGVIDQILAPLLPGDKASVEVGIGDDAAVLNLPRTHQLLATTDTLVEGVHFKTDSDPYLLGRKTMRVNLSDIAAMGGQPRWALLSMAMPPSMSLDWVREFARGLGEDGAAHGVALVGGDTVSSKGCITLSLTLLGSIGLGRAILRSSAQAGDLLYVSGTIGDALLGLNQTLGRPPLASADDKVYLERRHHLPEPRLALARGLQETDMIHAAIDVSDGLVADLRQLCRASRVGAEVRLDDVPLSPAAQRLVAQHGPELLHALVTGGEDYELLFTLPPAAAETMHHVAEAAGVTVTPIGVITAGEVNFSHLGKPVHFAKGGWEHF